LRGMELAGPQLQLRLRPRRRRARCTLDAPAFPIPGALNYVPKPPRHRVLHVVVADKAHTTEPKDRRRCRQWPQPGHAHICSHQPVHGTPKRTVVSPGRHLSAGCWAAACGLWVRAPAGPDLRGLGSHAVQRLPVCSGWGPPGQDGGRAGLRPACFPPSVHYRYLSTAVGQQRSSKGPRHQAPYRNAKKRPRGSVAVCRVVCRTLTVTRC
jgi:hypothetical protein